METSRQFEDLVIKVLQANNYDILNEQSNKDIDFLITTNGKKCAVEIKYYRTIRAQPTLIESAATRLALHAISVGLSKGVLIVSCVIHNDLRRKLADKLGIIFVDQVDLRVLASSRPDLLQELDALVEVDSRTNLYAPILWTDPLQEERRVTASDTL
jgi:hypothetical protein